MIIWLDAQLSPRLARWIEENFGVDCLPVRDFGLRDSEDLAIFQKARDAGVVIMTKDEDFVHLVERNGSPHKLFGLLQETCRMRVSKHSFSKPYRMPYP